VAYAIIINVFFFLCEVFVGFLQQYSRPHGPHQYLFVGLHGHGALVPVDVGLHDPHGAGHHPDRHPGITRKTRASLAVACVVIILGTWIDKGLGMISGGFVPNPLHEVNEYAPSIPEIGITLGVYAIGALVLTVLYKMAVKEEVHG
jgi:ABC-type dipeptide/oligopeptide/nickel transport system permease subunit